MAETRTNTRDNETREKTARTKSWRNPNELSDPTPRAGIKHRWIRKALLGKDDPVNVQKRVYEGWEPVAATEYPEYQHLANKDTGTIEQGGLVLCCTDDNVVAERNAHFEKRAQDQLTAIENDYLKVDDKRMPMNALGNPFSRQSKFGGRDD